MTLLDDQIKKVVDKVRMNVIYGIKNKFILIDTDTFRYITKKYKFSGMSASDVLSRWVGKVTVNLNNYPVPIMLVDQELNEDELTDAGYIAYQAFKNIPKMIPANEREKHIVVALKERRSRAISNNPDYHDSIGRVIGYDYDTRKGEWIIRRIMR